MKSRERMCEGWTRRDREVRSGVGQGAFLASEPLSADPRGGEALDPWLP